jgi:2,4-dienoyl-CoA reductase-like NADH-dependent reductase (Old Yellow Enzyme family)
MKAGADGVEIHAENGYLPHQFMTPTLNRRTYEYGGALANRLRFLGDVVQSVCANVPASRVGVRISPYAAYNNTRDPDPDGTTAAVSGMLERAGVAYLHLRYECLGWQAGYAAIPRGEPYFSGALIANGGITPPAARLVAGGSVDMFAFGKPFLPIPICPRIAAVVRSTSLGPSGGTALGRGLRIVRRCNLSEAQAGLRLSKRR